MREILFKAKRVDNGEWVEGYYMNRVNHEIIQEGTWIIWEVDKNTICQYTGLTDKNGNKIWENDIAKHGLITETVIFKDGSFGVYSNGSAVHLHVCYKNLEVFGNIF